VLHGWESRRHPAQLHYGWELERARSLDEAIRLVTEQALDLLELGAVERPAIFEPGCGIGGASTQAAERYPDATVVGMSLVASQIEIARRRARAFGVRNVEFVVGNYLATSFASESFDGVFAIEALCHTPREERKLLFAELLRVLRPSRRLVVFDGYLLREPVNGTERQAVDDVLQGWTLPVPGTPTEFTLCAVDAGFRLVREANVTPNIYCAAKRIALIADYALAPLSWLAAFQPFSPLVTRLGIRFPAGARAFIAACRAQKALFDRGLGAYCVHVFEKAASPAVACRYAGHRSLSRKATVS